MLFWSHFLALGPGLRRDGSLPDRSCDSRGKLAGFTMLEMSIVLVILGIMLAGGLAVFSVSLQKRQYDETREKLEAIRKTLLNYRIAFDRLPCPADITLAVSHANFGIEAANAASCAGGTPAANFEADGSEYDLASAATMSSAIIEVVTTNILVGAVISGSGGALPDGAFVISIIDATHLTASQSATATSSGTFTYTNPGAAAGMLPTQTLGLPDEYAFDGWGRRLFYAVNKDMTFSSAFELFGLDDRGQRMTVKENATVDKTTEAAYVLVSFGPNGHGAWPRVGGSARIDTDSTNTDELENCDCNAAATTTGFDTTFYQHDLTLTPLAGSPEDFDDMVIFGTRNDIVTPAE